MNKTSSKQPKIKTIQARIKKIQARTKKKLGMTVAQINEKLAKLHAKHLKSMDAEQLWDTTREILYFKIALGLLKKHRKQNLNELLDNEMQYDGALLFKIGNIYPDTVLIMAENYKSSVRLVQDFVGELSPYLNDAEQMLFKIAICEEHFKVE